METNFLINDELDDPFGDTQLFVARTLSNLLMKRTGDDQDELFALLRSAFQNEFPDRKLGSMMFQKIYDKVHYFHTLLKRHKNLISQSGKLNIDAIIRYHLKRCDRKARSELQTASAIAYKVSEWLATIEGKRCRIDQLTTRIWAAFKNIYPHLDAHKAPIHETDDFDRWIIKTQLYILAEDQIISERSLKNQITRQFLVLAKSDRHMFTDTCALIASIALAKATARMKAFALTESEKQALTKYVSAQIELSHPKNHVSEIGRRLISLYPLITKLPTHYTQEKLKAAITYIYTLASGEALPACPILDPSVYSFLNTQVIALMGFKRLPNLKRVTKSILKLFEIASNLPRLNDFEALLWKELIKQTKPDIDISLAPIVETTLFDQLIVDPKCNFSSIIDKCVAALRYDKGLIDTFLKSETSLENRLRNWTVQGDMLHRWTRFDRDTQLFDLASRLATKYKYLYGKTSTYDLAQVIADRFLDSYPRLHPFEDQLKRRIFGALKSIWYHSNQKASPIDKLNQWHTLRLKSLYPSLPKSEINQKLRASLRSCVPLCA